ncbi:MAG TPA: hemolysin III family protein [Vineibacter sp.]|nr:hemolysin III family protein [Vineibacter sp.]
MTLFPARQVRPAERLADNAIHIVGVTAGIVASVVLAVLSLPTAGARAVAGVSLYAGGLMAMLGCSALYNMAPVGAFKRLLRRLDHAAIFVMIAGTYTPFSLEVIGGVWGDALLAFVWTVALAGVTLKLVWPHRFERLSIVIYLLLGWSVLVALEPLLANISTPGLVLLMAGGALYSLGVVFHVWNRLPFQNALWHACVLAAAGCHYAAILHDVVLNT